MTKLLPIAVIAVIGAFAGVIGYLNIENHTEDQFVLAQDVDPANVTALMEKVNALGNLGKYEEAITYADKVLVMDQNHTGALNAKGYALGNLGKGEEAITYFDKVLAINSSEPDTILFKGTVLASLGKYEEAITYFDKVLAIYPNDTNAFSQKRMAQDELGK